MNKRFTWKFTKYIFIFLTITFIIGVIGIWLFFTNVIKISYSDLDDVDDFYMDFSISNEENGYKLSDDLKQKLNDNHVQLYIIDKDANVLYPKKQMNLKNKIVENLYNIQGIPFRSDDYSVILIYPKSHNHHIHSIEKIDTKKLISSLYINNYNKYYHVEKDNQLKFIDNPAYHKVQYTDEFNDIENKTFKFLALTYLLLLLLNMILVIIFAFIISKRLSKPLFFYTDWIENLSKGKLFKPSSKHYNKRSKKLFKELNDSVESLNLQLTEDKIYQNQINYYREKWLNQLSHDLKSPLTSIYGYAKLLSSEEIDTKKYAILISDKAAYMTELIDSLNNNFRYETDQMTIHKESFDITETLKQLRRTIQYDKLEIINELTEQKFYGNKLYFERMMMNLIDNSIDHNKRNPNIEINIKNINEGLEINYKDDGVGISKTTEKHMLHSNYTTKDNKEGHGIGSTIIMDCITFHNGTFKIMPTTKGVNFKIHLN
ncbi:sensor histidine kinase [Mammaliicoccus sciuri]|uniref:sensor histidine kinase n=1 Tax=Mammaliicoccus sciuri TaxID=1296 RepID=UPI0015FE4140|nr:HAMP domain-containing sensor histidine kinase [Mammaliicoccus sciuri]